MDDRTLLGKTLLPQTLTSLLKVALEGSNVPDDTRAPAVFELLRVGANLCMDHSKRISISDLDLNSRIRRREPRLVV